jgi:hypothetical protein
MAEKSARPTKPTPKTNRAADLLRFVSIADFAMRTTLRADSVAALARSGRLRSVKIGKRRLIPISELWRALRQGI